MKKREDEEEKSFEYLILKFSENFSFICLGYLVWDHMVEAF